jgi:hypothetical protein
MRDFADHWLWFERIFRILEGEGEEIKFLHVFVPDDYETFLRISFYNCECLMDQFSAGGQLHSKNLCYANGFVLRKWKIVIWFADEIKSF